MYVLACCNNEGRCIGFLNNAKQIETDQKLFENERWIKQNLLQFKKKSDANETVMQINLGHMLLPNGAPYRVAAVKM